MKRRNFTKLLLFLSLLLTFTILPWAAIPPNGTSVLAIGGYGGASAGGGGRPTYYLQVNLSGTETVYIINSYGELDEPVERASGDKLLILNIPIDTVALNPEGEPLRELNITIEESPPPPPEGANIIGPVYNFQPTGATFNPPIILIFYYESQMLPEAVDEEELVLAYFDEENSEWVTLFAITNPLANSLTVDVSHLTTFAILARPHLAFEVSDLSITPNEVNIGEKVTISLLATNPGILPTRYEVPCCINGTLESTQVITLVGGSSEEIVFTAIKDIAGTYTVTVGDLQGIYIVKKPPELACFTTSNLSITPAQVNAGEAVTITAQVTNIGDLTGTYKVTLNIDGTVIDTKEVTLAGNTSQKVSFTTSKDIGGIYTVKVNSQVGKLSVKMPPKPINWWYIAATIIGVILVYWGIFVLASRRRE